MDRFQIVQLALNESPFYQQKYSGLYSQKSTNGMNFAKLPFLTKEELQQSGNLVFCEGEKNRHKQLFKTSGTTGLPLHIYWDTSDYVKSMMCLWNLRRLWYGIGPQHNFGTFHSVARNSQGVEQVDVLLTHQDRVLSFGRCIYSEETLAKYFNYWHEFDPVWIQGPASVLLLFADYQKKHPTVLRSLRYIELVGEYVDQATQQHIAKVFSVPVANMYGSVEFNGIALSCPEGHMHILTNNVYVETIGRKELVITGLNNTYMPLIRYKIGDMGELYEPSTCAYGKGPCIDIKRGRQHELIEVEGSFFVDPDVLTNVVEQINKEELIVRRFCLVKNGNKVALRAFVLPEHVPLLMRQKRFLVDRLISLKRYGLDFDLEIELATDYEKMDLGYKYSFFKDETSYE